MSLLQVRGKGHINNTLVSLNKNTPTKRCMHARHYFFHPHFCSKNKKNESKKKQKQKGDVPESPDK